MFYTVLIQSRSNPGFAYLNIIQASTFLFNPAILSHYSCTILVLFLYFVAYSTPTRKESIALLVTAASNTNADPRINFGAFPSLIKPRVSSRGFPIIYLCLAGKHPTLKSISRLYRDYDSVSLISRMVDFTWQIYFELLNAAVSLLVGSDLA